MITTELMLNTGNTQHTCKCRLMGRVALVVDFGKRKIGMSRYSMAFLLPTCIESKKQALHVDNCAENMFSMAQDCTPTLQFVCKPQVSNATC